MNYQQVSDETKKFFKERITTKHLEGLKWGVISNSDFKITKDKMLGKALINNAAIRARHGEDVLFIINEPVFDRLSEKHKIIAMDKLLAYVEYDMENEKVKKSQPDILEHSGILMTYDFMQLQSLSSEISRIFQEIKEENTRTDGKEE